MSSRSSSRLWAAIQPSTSIFRPRNTQQSVRPFSQTWLRQADEPSSSSNDKPAATPAPAPGTTSEAGSNASGLQGGQNTMSKLSAFLNPGSDASSGSISQNPVNSRNDTLSASLTRNVLNRSTSPTESTTMATARPAAADNSILGHDAWDESLGPIYEPFHFHIMSTKRNCHITVTKPNRGAILSMSTGNIGFRKAKRGTYDAAYQLAAYVIDKLHQGNWHRKIHQMEVVLKGWGHGREAATKVLLGSEGRMLRGHIVRVSDNTTIKFGGTRSKRPRRLG